MSDAITTDQVPQLNTMFRLQWEQAQDCYVLLYPEGMVKLNGPAGEILSRVDSKRSVADICQLLSEKFPEAGDISGDIVEFLTEAQRQRWVTF